ncbi:MAG: bifunctional oligoribonuclease/PAP phosphatase NrnA [bacterium]
MWNQITAVLRDNDNFLLTSHIRPDGDAICSCLALHRILKEMGKSSRWVLTDPPPSEFSFLYDPSEFERLEQSTPLDEVRVVCALDIPEWSRAGEMGERLGNLSAVKICLDHHPRRGTMAEPEIRDVDASATAVLLYRLVKHLDHPLSLPVAEAIYTGVLTDTMSFHLANTNEEAHEVAAACIQAGVEPAPIYEIVYGTVSMARLKLTSQALSTLGVADGGRVAYIYATRDMYEKANAKRGDDEDMIEFARSLEGVDVALFLRELENGQIRVSWRARGDVDVSASARHFGGGGHVRAAGAEVSGPIDQALKDVVAEAVARVNQAGSSSA